MGTVWWKWPFTFSLSIAVACVSYFKLEPWDILSVGIKTLFELAILTIGIQYVGFKLYRTLSKKKTQQQESTEDEARKATIYEEKTKKSRAESQAKFEEQAESYKERILTPREEAKRKKKDEEFYRFMGPAWKGKGDKLGGEDTRQTSQEMSGDVSREAGEIRQLPSSVLLHIPRQEQTKQKKVIQLPEEPGGDCPDVTLIVLRTPLGTVHKRRFLRTSVLQVLFDYMTSLGFHQTRYTLSRSYPRQPMTNEGEKTLDDLDFGRQVILNVEEKDV